MRDILFKKKLLYRSIYRGCKESEHILSSFSKRYLNTMSVDDLHHFKEILDYPDQDLILWLTKQKKITKKLENNPVMQNLMNFIYE